MLVALAAAGWAVFQYHLVFGEMFPPPDEEFSLLVPPVGFFLFALLFWGAVVVLTRGQTAASAMTWGLLSPLAAAAFFGFFLAHWGLVAVFHRWYFAFPIGMVSGALVHLSATIGADRPAPAADSSPM